MDRQSLLEQRKRSKAKKPDFIMQDTHKKPKLKHRWRKPRGIDSKMRLRLRGYRASVSKGWKSPAAVRGMTRKGLRPVIISTVAELGAIDAKKDEAVISSSVGTKARLLIAKKSIGLGITFGNMKEPASYIKNIEERIATRKKQKTEAVKAKEEKLKDKEKAVKEKEEKEKRDKEEKEKKDREEKEKEGKEKKPGGKPGEELAAGAGEGEKGKKAEDMKETDASAEKKELDRILTTKEG